MTKFEALYSAVVAVCGHLFGAGYLYRWFVGAALVVALAVLLCSMCVGLSYETIVSCGANIIGVRVWLM